jgi:hypothetical protein
MTVPDYSGVVFGLAATFGPRDSREKCGQFVELCAAEIHKLDPEFGHLRKMPGQTQYNGHALDVILHRATGHSVDILRAAKLASPETPAEAVWQVEEIARYTDAATYWIAPVSTPAPVPGPGPSPNPGPGAPGGNPPACGCASELEAVRVELETLRAESGARDQEIVRALGFLADQVVKPRALEMRVPAFGGTARGTSRVIEE